MDFHSVIMGRMQGSSIKRDLELYRSLVRAGCAGFVVFGAELDELKEAISRLQGEASIALIIASDLEQGLGQQVRGGTLFPPARAIMEATRNDPALRKHAFTHMACEIRASGINTVFAPVLDVDSNPKNPIVSTRAYSSNADTVSKIAEEYILIMESHGIRTCGKHFPGHGDTLLDSHLGLPTLDKTIEQLGRQELKPFKAGISAGASMMMLAHMDVPALDSVPTSLSKKTVELLREKLGFNGIITTDALDMGALREFGQERAAAMALEAGVDILLHPSDPHALANALKETSTMPDTSRLDTFRRGLARSPEGEIPPGGEELSLELSKRALLVEGKPRPLNKPTLVIASDEEKKIDSFEMGIEMNTIVISSEEGLHSLKRPEGDLVLALHSSIRAYKGGASRWLQVAASCLAPEVTIAFGPPALLEGSASTVKITAWWGEKPAQAAVECLFKDL